VGPTRARDGATLASGEGLGGNRFMMFLQADMIQIGSGMISLTTLVLVLRLTYGAGQLVEKVEANEKRLDHLEAVRCPHLACPLRVKFGIPEIER
jgi:hypothetical protein